jgi:hypothetical protein
MRRLLSKRTQSQEGLAQYGLSFGMVVGHILPRIAPNKFGLRKSKAAPVLYCFLQFALPLYAQGFAEGVNREREFWPPAFGPNRCGVVAHVIETRKKRVNSASNLFANQRDLSGGFLVFDAPFLGKPSLLGFEFKAFFFFDSRSFETFVAQFIPAPDLLSQKNANQQEQQREHRSVWDFCKRYWNHILWYLLCLALGCLIGWNLRGKRD